MTDFLEKTLEDIIFENKDIIHERGFSKFYECSKRQFKLPSGKTIDILTWEVRGNVIYATIIELKKDYTYEAAFWQVLDYYSEFLFLCCCQYQDWVIDMVICGAGNNSENVENLSYMDIPLSVFRYDYTMNGIFFKRELSPFMIKDFKSDHERAKPSSIGLELSKYLNAYQNNIIYKQNR